MDAFVTHCRGKEARYGVAQLRSIRTDVSISLKRHSIDMSVVIGASMRNFGSRLFPRFAVNGDAFCAVSHLLPCRRCTKIAITNIPERRRLGFSKAALGLRSEEHTSELQSLMRISYAVFCLKKKRSPHQT